MNGVDTQNGVRGATVTGRETSRPRIVTFPGPIRGEDVTSVVTYLTTTKDFTLVLISTLPFKFLL